MMQKVFTWELFTWGGRVGRIKYFGNCVIATLVCLAAFAIGQIFIEIFPWSFMISSSMKIIMLFGIGVAVWIGIVTNIKRLHDINFSGCWLIPIMLLRAFSNSPASILQEVLYLQEVTTFIVFGCSLWLLFMPGSPGDNRFGLGQAKLGDIAVASGRGA